MNSPRSWNLRVDPGVFKILKKMPRRDAEVVLNVIRLSPVNPFFGDIQKMRGGDNIWRRRVGSYRIFYKIMIAEKTILVFRLERRTSKTY